MSGESDSGRKRKGILAVVECSYKLLRIKSSRLPHEYRSLIYSKFLRSLKFGNDYFRLIDSDSYYSNYQKYITLLLDRPEAELKFAVLTEDPDVVLGWALIEPNKLHYVHVHKDNRRIGIGSELISDPFKQFSHITSSWMKLWTKRCPQARFDPFI